MWATPFATEHGHPVYELLGAELAPGSRTFGQAAIVDPYIGEATGTSPDLAVSSTGQADVVYRVVNFSSLGVRCCARRTSSRASAWRRFNGERWTSLGDDQPRPRRLDAPADGSQRAADRDRADRQRDRRLAGARSDRRRTHLGATDLRAVARLRDAGHRDDLQRGADRQRRRCPCRRDLEARPGRGRLPPALGHRLAAARPADLPQHAVRRRIRIRRAVPRRCDGRPERRRRQARLDRAARASTSTNDARRGCSTTATGSRA